MPDFRPPERSARRAISSESHSPNSYCRWFRGTVRTDPSWLLTCPLSTWTMSRTVRLNFLNAFVNHFFRILLEADRLGCLEEALTGCFLSLLMINDLLRIYPFRSIYMNNILSGLILVCGWVCNHFPTNQRLPFLPGEIVRCLKTKKHLFPNLV